MANSRLLFIVGMVCLLLALAAPAQDFRATITGVVTDQSGAAVPGATVKVTRINTNETEETKTNAGGRYTVPYLNPAEYNVEITASGFKTLKRENIILRVADKLDLSVQLQVGAVSESVTVTAEQEIIDTASADRGLVFDSIKVQQYPLNGRQTYMLLSLTPGVVFTQEQFGASGFSGTRGWDVNSSYKINGARTGQNLFLLNGAPISNNGGTWQVAPNVEAVQEFKVMTNTYDSAYGRFGGGVVNTTLKSGSNSWHGDVYEFWRNRVLDANNFQNNTAGIPRGFHNQHQFGGVVGGPIRKDKDFIFASFEGWQEVVPFPALASTPPLALRDGQGFTALGYKIYDPLTTHVCAAPEPCQGQTYIANQFPNNVIPQARISPIGAKIVSYFPAPNTTGLNNNFVAGQNLGRYYYEQPMARWDHIFNQNDKMHFIYTGQQGYEYRSSTGFPRPAATGNTNNQRTDQNAILSHTHILSPTTVLDVRLSFGRFIQTTPGFSDFSLTAKDLGMTGFTPSPTSPGNVAPSITVGGYSSPILSGGTAFSWSSYNQWNLAPSLNMTHGKHAIRTGFEVNYVMNGSVSTGSSNGQFAFGTSWTQQLQARQQNATDGSGVATLLLGYPASVGNTGAGSIAYNDTIYRTRPYYGFYVQDDWKVTSRLTLNLGLRYDVQIPWLERYGRENRGFSTTIKNPLSDQMIAAWTAAKTAYDKANPSAAYPYPAPPSALNGGFLFPGVGGQPSRLYDTDWTNIAPRIGVAYRIGDKTVVRGGGGIYYQSTTQGGTTSGFSQSTSYTTSLDGGVHPSAGSSLTGPYSLNNPFPNGFAAPSGSSLGLLTNVGNGIGWDPTNVRIPRTWQYSFGIQRELPGAIVAEISYAGNFQNHIVFGYDTNRRPLADQLKAIADPSYYNRTLPNPFFGILPITSSQGSSSTITASNLLRPNPLFQGMTDNLNPLGWYRSDQLQVRIEKRILGGGKTGAMTWVVAYAFSKAFEANHFINDYEPKPVKELDNTNKAQNLSFHGVWELPFGTKLLNVSNPVARGIVGNWSLNWTLMYESGNPTGWPNLINTCGDWHAKTQDENSWFNNDKTCYQQFRTNQFRTLPDRFPDIQDPAVGPFLNLGVQKVIQVSERYRLEFRAESFNLTNHVQRPGPDTSFTSTTFGQLPKSQLNFPRVQQLSAKFYF